MKVILLTLIIRETDLLGLRIIRPMESNCHWQSTVVTRILIEHHRPDYFLG
jgi:hypothetical protein